MQRGRLFVISAPSGTGKTTIVRQLAAMLPHLIHSISVTTRSPRKGEIDGGDYHFVDQAAFQRMVDAGDFVEWAEVHGKRYGTPRAPLEQWRDEGTDVICDLDVQGWRSVRQHCPDAVGIFLMPPSREILVERLKGRGTEDAEALRRRLEEADREMAAKDEYHYVVTNDSIAKACREIARILAMRKGPDHP